MVATDARSLRFAVVCLRPPTELSWAVVRQRTGANLMSVEGAVLWVAGLGAAGAIGELHSGELGDRREPELVGVEVARPVDVVRGGRRHRPRCRSAWRLPTMVGHAHRSRGHRRR